MNFIILVLVERAVVLVGAAVGTPLLSVCVWASCMWGDEVAGFGSWEVVGVVIDFPVGDPGAEVLALFGGGGHASSSSVDSSNEDPHDPDHRRCSWWSGHSNQLVFCCWLLPNPCSGGIGLHAALFLTVLILIPAVLGYVMVLVLWRGGEGTLSL